MTEETNDRTVEIHIPVGKHGCGKTYTFHRLAANDRKGYCLHVDDTPDLTKYTPDIYVEYLMKSKLFFTMPIHLYIDHGTTGTGTELFDNIVGVAMSIFRHGYDERYRLTDGFKAIIHYWKPDIKTCIINDKLVGKNNESDIKTSILTYPDIDHLKSYIERIPILAGKFKEIRIEEHETVCGDAISATVEKDRSHLTDGGKAILSEQWKDGEEPQEFTLFDDILRAVNPDIDSTLREKIWNESEVTVKTARNHSFMYGFYNTNYYFCNLDKLRLALLNNGQKLNKFI